MTDFQEDIKRLLSNQFDIPVEEIEEDSNLEEDLGLSELDLEDLVSSIQEKYDIAISPEQISSFKKVSDITLYLYENAGDIE
jgi:acyl carrier protein